MDYDRWKVKRNDLVGLANQVVHTSVAEGDDAGYDIQSFDLKGSKQFIEVKATACTNATPFRITKNKVRFSREYHEQIRICRVFDLRRNLKFFVLSGKVDDHGVLDAELFRMHNGPQ